MSRRIAIYARVSTAEQARDGATSIAKQVDAGHLEARRMAQFSEGGEVVKVYKDEGVTGTTRFEDREGGAALLKDAGRGKFDTVVFYSLDRFTRHAAKGLADFEYMEDALGLTIVFVKENIDTSTASGKLFRTILAGFAEFERDTIRDRAMAGRYGRAEEGQGWVTGMPPYGYTVGEDGDLVVVEHEAATLRRMFLMRSEGHSLKAIASHLNDNGHTPRTHRGTPGQFSIGAVHHYLRRPAYKGEPIVRTLKPSVGGDPKRFEFPAPTIVHHAIWERAQNPPPIGG